VSGRSLRAGVVGLGWAGQQHMAAYADLPGVELVALAGRETEPLGRLGDQFAVAPDLRFDDWSDLVASADLDVLSIAAPTTLHAPIAIAALDAGVHVLSEKPLAESAEAGERMVQAAERNQRVLDVSFNHRRRGVVKALKGLLDGGSLGPIYYAKAGWVRRQGIPTLGSWFTSRVTAGGGPLMDLGVHMIDMVLHLLDEPEVRTVTAATYAEFGPRGLGGSPTATVMKTSSGNGTQFDVEDLSTAFLRLSGGATLLLEASWAQWVPEDLCYVTVYGADGGAGITWIPGSERRTLEIWTEDDGSPQRRHPEIPPDGEHRETVVDFLELVRTGQPVHGRHVLTRSAVVDACYASAEAGHEVALSVSALA
jgi:predicted dehydrogenase